MKEKVRKLLFDNQDLKYQEFSKKLIPGVDNIIGIRIPKLREIAKELLKDNYLEYINLEKEYFEETMLEGILIAKSKIDINDKLLLLDNFIPKINNWSVNDSCVMSFKLKKNEMPVMWDYAKKYIKSKNEYDLRFILVMWDSNFINDEYIDKVLAHIDLIKSDYYYVKMAKAWLISTAFIKYRDKTYNYLLKNKLDDWTYNKSIQKIIESYRVSAEDKKLLRQMKRK